MKAQITLLLFILSGLLVAQDLDIDSLKNVIKEELKTELALENNKEKSKERLLKWSKFNLRGYGVVNYYNYGRFDTDPNIRDKMDAERLNLYLDYHFTDKLKFHSEIEFEHGGTGTTLELDVQEEFGEYEQEIEAGGEVKIEQLNIEYLFKPYLNFKMGRMKIYFNLSQRLDTPDEYFTTHRQEMEDALLPLGWYENGVLLHGRFLNDKFSYQTALVNGLESTGFSSANWIRNGYQTKFEMVNAENLAWFANLNYHFGKDKNTLAGISYYYGNTSENRPKNDLGVDAYVKIFGAHLSVFEYPFRFASQFLYGDLQNSERVSLRNRNIPATLGVKKTPVAKNAIGFSVELGYDILDLLNKDSKMKLYPFARYDFYDTMHETSGSIVANKRWKRSVITAGLNWFIFPQVILKAQYSSRKLGSDNVNIATGEVDGKQMENIFSTGIGFTF
ncbi:MAG: autotransporter outer membrane beta-barrel domain-containing protein [Moheibacter sp.]